MKDSVFFYALRWEEPKTLIKFGYKESAKAFRDNYAKFNHYKPLESYIWILDYSVGSRDLSFVDETVISYFTHHVEQSIHRDLVRLTTVKRIARHREVYAANTLECSLGLIRKRLSTIQDDLPGFQSQEEQKSLLMGNPSLRKNFHAQLKKRPS